ncbi:MAG: queuosine precursor transporter [Proteobacteria bacterium]|nr:queuosine precursor transporter [Pseudomonadota bacterium]
MKNQPKLKIAIGDTWHPKLLPYFAMALVAFMITTNVLNLKFINFYGFSLISSQFVYVCSLVLADIMAEVYGYRRVRRILYVGLALLAFYVVCLQITVYLPPAADYPNDQAFRLLFSQTPRIALASIVAYFFTEFTNSYIMSNLKVRLNGRHFMGRAVVSVAVAQALNVIIFFGVAFAGVMPLGLIASACFMSWLITIGCEVLILPFTRQLAWRVKAYEGVEHFDKKPHTA